MAKASKAPAKKSAPAKVVVKKSAAKKTAVKKSAVKKLASPEAAPGETSAKKEPTIHIKYEDKSAGQPDLVVIFDQLKKMMEPYDKKRSLVLHAKPSQSILVSHKPVEIDGRKMNELWFVAALVQKGYVGFYFVPVYMRTEMKKHFSPELLKCLKGKSCFHLKKNDPVLMKEIKGLIKTGYEGYIERGLL